MHQFFHQFLRYLKGFLVILKIIFKPLKRSKTVSLFMCDFFDKIHSTSLKFGLWLTAPPNQSLNVDRAQIHYSNDFFLFCSNYIYYTVTTLCTSSRKKFFLAKMLQEISRKKFNARLARNLNQQIGEKELLKRSRLEKFIQ